MLHHGLPQGCAYYGAMAVEDQGRDDTDRRAVGHRQRGGSHWRRMKEGGADMPLYLSANNLKPFIDKELELALNDSADPAGEPSGEQAAERCHILSVRRVKKRRKRVLS